MNKKTALKRSLFPRNLTLYGKNKAVLYATSPYEMGALDIFAYDATHKPCFHLQAAKKRTGSSLKASERIFQLTPASGDSDFRRSMLERSRAS